MSSSLLCVVVVVVVVVVCVCGLVCGVWRDTLKTPHMYIPNVPVCTGNTSTCAIMSVFQCDVYRDRRQADYLRRSAVLIRSSVGDMSYSHRLNVDKEFRLVLSGSCQRFTGKEISTGTLAVRRVGNMFHDREFADVLLRRLLQSGSRITSLRCSASWLRVGSDAFPRMRRRYGQKWRTSCTVPTSVPGDTR